MRAIYLKEFKSEIDPLIEGEQAHHLLNVVRIKIGAEILILNGKGESWHACISQILKNKIYLDILGENKHQPKLKMTLAMGLVKKDALELMIRQACELGFSDIVILETEYSQNYKLNLKRLDKILVSAIEQSNNPFIPNIKLMNLKELRYEQYSRVILYSTINQNSSPRVGFLENQLVLIGPEGGFSMQEEEFICNRGNVVTYLLDTYILRAPTALCVAVGHLLGMNS